MQTTIIYITGVYDTLDLFTQELKNAFESMGYASFTYDARLEEVSKQALIEYHRKCKKSIKHEEKLNKVLQ